MSDYQIPTINGIRYIEAECKTINVPTSDFIEYLKSVIKSRLSNESYYVTIFDISDWDSQRKEVDKVKLDDIIITYDDQVVTRIDLKNQNEVFFTFQDQISGIKWVGFINREALEEFANLSSAKKSTTFANDSLLAFPIRIWIGFIQYDFYILKEVISDE